VFYRDLLLCQNFHLLSLLFSSGTTTPAPEQLETTSPPTEPAEEEQDEEEEQEEGEGVPGATTENWRARGAKRRKKVVKVSRTTTEAPGNQFYFRGEFGRLSLYTL
jgi:hypothetical protein